MHMANPLFSSFVFIRKKQPGESNRKWLLSIWKDVEWPFVIGLGVLSLFLGYAGYRRYFAASGTICLPINCFYLSLQLFTMNFNSGGLDQQIPITLQIARFLAPALAAYTFLQALLVVFKDQIDLLTLARMREHTIICGLGRKGMLLTKDLRQAGVSVVIIECDGNNPNLENCREMGAVILISDARDEMALRKANLERAQRIIAVCGDDGTNIEVAEHARLFHSKYQKSELTCTVHIVDTYLWSLLRKREFNAEQNSSFRLELFNIYDSGARTLLRKTFQPEDQLQPHLLVVGMGNLGEYLIVRAAQMWCKTYAHTCLPLPITIVDPDVSRKLAALQIRFPLITTVCRFNSLIIRTDWPEFQKAANWECQNGFPQVTHAYICLEDPAIGLHAGFTLLQTLAEQKIKIMVRMTEDAGLAKFLQETRNTGEAISNFEAFGLLEQTCKIGLFDDGTHESLARAIHEAYVRDQVGSGRTDQNDPSLAEWDRLAIHLRQSNRHQADHIGIKLKAVGCDIIPWREYGAENFAFRENEIEKMARMEHERWCQERERTGWRFHAERDKVNKLHPDLLPWDDPRLSLETKEKNRQEVRLIPALLAYVGFQVYRIDQRNINSN